MTIIAKESRRCIEGASTLQGESIERKEVKTYYSILTEGHPLLCKRRISPWLSEEGKRDLEAQKKSLMESWEKERRMHGRGHRK